jgi:hypothetical protein
MINNIMQVNIFINDKLYKTVTVEGNTYNPNQFWSQIQADKEAGLLAVYNVDTKLSVRYEKA